MNLDFVTAHSKDLGEQTHSAVTQWHTIYHLVFAVSQYAKFNGIENIKKFFFSERKIFQDKHKYKHIRQQM